MYTASLVSNTNSLQSLPNSMEFDVASNGDLEFLVDTTNENDVDEYVIQIQGSLDEGP